MSLDSDGFRLSPQQKRLWLLQSHLPTLPTWAVVAVHLAGEPDVAHLEGSLTRLVADQEILRTTFRCLPGTTIPLQVIREPRPIALARHDLAQLDPTAQAATLHTLLDPVARAAGDSEQEGTIEAALVTLGPAHSLLVLAVPALCADRQSLYNLVAALFEPLSGDEEAVQYADVAEIFNDVLESEETAAGREYWEQQAAPPLTLEQLPFRRPSAPGEATLATHTLALPAEQVAALEALAARSGTTLASVCLACWQGLLGRLSETAPTVGVTYHGRSYEGLDTALGLFTRTLPFRSMIGEEQPFSALLEEVHARAVALTDWQDYFTWEPWGGTIVDGKRINAFPIAFDFEAVPLLRAPSGPRPTVEQASVWHDFASLTLHLRHTVDALTLHLHYDAARLEASEVARLADQFLTFCQSATARPDAPLATLTLVSPTEQQRLVEAHNQTERPYPRDRALHQLFEEQVARSPQQPALSYRDETWSFEQLDRRANRLAHHLRGLGVGPDKLVALFMERSPEMVVGLLGVLKAGGAYLPLDTSYPAERLDFMLADSRAPVVLTQAALRERLPTFQGHVLTLDSDWGLLAEADEALPTALSPHNLAYVIYTSGSTGRPKGTLIPHQGLVNYVTWAAAAYGVQAGSGCPMHTPIGFDLTVTSLLVPLVAGQRVVLLPEGPGLDGLQAVLRDESDLSLVKITPAHLDALNQLLTAEQVAGRVRTFVIGGEALLGSSLAFWHRHAPETRLINEYGPTETVVGCCVYEVPAESLPTGAVPIGRPIANTRLYVLDPRGQLSPEGVPGELYIGGAGVARGYLNRPELTAERFVPDPFGPEAGARLYRTGDQVRYLPDGTLEYLGRLDDQVKLRGFRVELGEIEALLARHPAVREGAVLVHGGDGDRWQQRLVAYVVPWPDAGSERAEIRDFLAGQLPDYMLPSTFVWLDALPLTSNGKLDRRALAALPLTEESALPYLAPRTAIEGVLASVWGELLGVEQVGVQNSFFQMGGHSLLLIQLNSRIRKIFQLDLGLNALFEAPTIEQMAALLVAREPSPGRSETIARTLQAIQSLSPEEKQRLLDQKREQATVRDGE